jgi:hypothetical protein
MEISRQASPDTPEYRKKMGLLPLPLAGVTSAQWLLLGSPSKSQLDTVARTFMLFAELIRANQRLNAPPYKG